MAVLGMWMGDAKVSGGKYRFLRWKRERAGSDGRSRFFERMVVFWVKNGRKTRKRGGKSSEKREKVWFPEQVLKNGQKIVHRSS